MRFSKQAGVERCRRERRESRVSANDGPAIAYRISVHDAPRTREAGIPRCGQQPSAGRRTNGCWLSDEG